MVCAGLLALLVARKVVGLRWTATVVAGAYLAYRCGMWLALVATGFPPSDVPFVLLVGAVLVDLAVTYRLAGWMAGAAVTGIVYGAALGQDELGILPPWNWWTALPVAIGFGLLWTAVDGLARSGWLTRWRAAQEPGPDPVPNAPRLVA
jgi:hypothetical protein